MKSQAVAIPPRPALARGFEINRLARGFLAQAYEQVMALDPSRAPRTLAVKDKPNQTRQERMAA